MAFESIHVFKMRKLLMGTLGECDWQKMTDLTSAFQLGRTDPGTEVKVDFALPLALDPN
jgi:hypothetical protein